MLFINKLSAVVLALCAASVSAKGSQPSDTPFPQGKPCIVQVTTNHWANVNTLFVVYKGFNICSYGCDKKGVVWVFGREYVQLITSEPDLIIKNFFDSIERTCK